jgi:hypothetical protein
MEEFNKWDYLKLLSLIFVYMLMLINNYLYLSVIGMIGGLACGIWFTQAFNKARRISKERKECTKKL